MKGFILAAGFGQRMLPITETLPKPLLPIGNLPLIVYAIKLLAHHGIVDIGINLHYLGDALKEALGDGSALGVHITYSEETEILGTGGGLKRMHQFVDSTTVVVNSDTVIDLDLSAKIKEHQARGALATMVLRDDPRREEFGQIEIDKISGQIKRILGQGPAPTEPVDSRMFTGVHILEPRFSIGFGPTLVRYQSAHTLWQVSIIPLGGYVIIDGMGPSEEDEAQASAAGVDNQVPQAPIVGSPHVVPSMAADSDPSSYRNKPAWQRALVIAAGPAANWVP